MSRHRASRHRRARRWLPPGTAALSMLLFTAPADATRQPPMTLDALIHQSGRIIEATVTGYDPTAGDTTAPATRVDLHVITALGPATGDARLTLWLPEGIEASGAAWAGYEGVPTFAPGHTYLLFLRRDPWRISPVVNWSAAHLRRAEIAGRAVYVDMQGACAAALDDHGVQLGPRVVDPPPVPGHDTWSSIPPQPSAVDRCMPAAELRARLTARIHRLGWQPAPVPLAPRDRALIAPVWTGEP